MTTSTDEQTHEKDPIVSLLWSDGKQTSRPVTMVHEHDKFWFLAKDICDILELPNVGMFIEDLPVSHRQKKSVVIDAARGVRSMWFLSEAGLYQAIFRSEAPNARPFQTWVTDEVLPEIRRTGRYIGKPVRVPLAEHEKRARKTGTFIFDCRPNDVTVIDWSERSILCERDKIALDGVFVALQEYFATWRSETGAKLIAHLPPPYNDRMAANVELMLNGLAQLHRIYIESDKPFRDILAENAAACRGDVTPFPNENPYLARLRTEGLITGDPVSGYRGVENAKRNGHGRAHEEPVPPEKMN